jgi:Tfp pilus assembly protein PilF
MAVLLGGCTKSQKQTRHMERGKQLLVKKDYPRALIEFRNALRQNEEDPEAWYQLGLVYQAGGDAQNAARSFYKATQLDPRHVGAQIKISELMVTSRDQNWTREVQKRMTDVLTISQDNLEAMSTLAAAEWRLGDKEGAERRLQAALDKFPRDLKTTVELAQIKLARKDLAGAEEVLKKLTQQQQPTAQAFVALAQFHALGNRETEAEQEFERALQIDAKDPMALLEFAAMRMRQGRKEQADELYKRVSMLPDRQYRPTHALFLWQTGQQNAAVSEFENLAKGDPSDPDARTRLVTGYVLTGRKAEAQQILNATLERRPKDIDALLQRSELLIQAGKFTEAQNDLLQATRFHPESASAHYLLAKLHGARGAGLSQRQELTEALRLDPSLLRARLVLAQSLITSNAAKSALEVLNATPAFQKEMLPVLVERNWTLIAMHDDDDARKGVDEGLAKARIPDLLTQDAILKSNTKDLTGARASLNEALAGNPGDVRALSLLALTYASGKDAAPALRILREHASKYPNLAGVQFLLAQWLQTAGATKEARASFEATLAADPKHIPAKIALAQRDAAEGRLDAARQRLKEPAEAGDVTACLVLASVEEVSGNRAVALQMYRSLADAGRGNALILNNLAFLISEHENKPDEALTYAQKANQLMPETPAIQDTLGWIMYRKGLYSSAVGYLERSVAKDPTAMHQYHLAMAYLQAGDHKRGNEALKAALRLDPRLPEAQLALQLQAEKGAMR